MKKLEKWINKDAASYVKYFSKYYGEPETLTDHYASWDVEIGPTKFHYSKDESLLHKFPVEHKDHFYSVMNLRVSPEQQKKLIDVTESIIVDRLAETVTARCGNIVANSVTLGFVEDFVYGRLGKVDLKKEYGERIMSEMTPDWYNDISKEKSKDAKKYVPSMQSY